MFLTFNSEVVTPDMTYPNFDKNLESTPNEKIEKYLHPFNKSPPIHFQ